MAEAKPPDDGAIRVLVVDGAAEAFADRLARAGDPLEVDAAETASAALDRLGERDVDCIVAGYELPGMDGLALLRAVRAERPALPFILCPRDGSEALAAEAIDAGVTNYVRRDGEPERLATLVERIDAAVSGGSERSAASVHARYEKLIHHSTDVVFVVDANGTYQYVSPAVEAILG